jgi:Domain of unknown function (DUF4252)
MKNRLLIVIVALMLSAFKVGAQSKSFMTLRGQFKDMEDVHTFNIGGLFARWALSLADDNIHCNAVKHLGTVHLIIIPKEHFVSKGLSMRGYKRFIQKEDYFEELLNANENRERAALFVAPSTKNINRYLLLLESEDKVVAIEFTGDLDPTKFLQADCDKSSSI